MCQFRSKFRYQFNARAGELLDVGGQILGGEPGRQPFGFRQPLDEAGLQHSQKLSPKIRGNVAVGGVRGRGTGGTLSPATAATLSG